MVAIGSGTTDPYQPLERTERVVGRSAELLAEAARPVLVMTKPARHRRSPTRSSRPIRRDIRREPALGNAPLRRFGGAACDDTRRRFRFRYSVPDAARCHFQAATGMRFVWAPARRYAGTVAHVVIGVVAGRQVFGSRSGRRVDRYWITSVSPRSPSARFSAAKYSTIEPCASVLRPDARIRIGLAPRYRWRYIGFMKTNRLVALLSLLVASCAPRGAGAAGIEAAPSQSEAGGDTTTVRSLPPRIGYDALAALMANGSVLLLDVRTQEEFDAGHIPGAVLAPYDALQTAFAEPDKNRPIVVYCRSGRRSAIAAETLSRMGYADIADFGSIDSWKGPLRR